MFAGSTYCLTRLGFGLIVVQQIMKTIIGAVLSQEEKVKEVRLQTINEIYVNEDIVLSLHVRTKLA